jgi:hypothetical protein
MDQFGILLGSQDAGDEDEPPWTEENYECYYESDTGDSHEVLAKSENDATDWIFQAENVDPDTTCLICLKKLETPAKLNIHMKARHQPKKFFCDQCDKGFASKNNLRAHMYHHRKYFEVECRACKRKYKTVQSLRYHLRHHFEHYPCEHCGREFELKRLLEAHIATCHDHNLRANCRFCSRTFSRADQRNKHEDKVHGDGGSSTQFTCNECILSFNYRRELIHHNISVHYKGNVHSCEVCGKFPKILNYLL